VLEVEELIGILEDVMTAVIAAQKSANMGDTSNILYNIDHAEIDIMRARNLAVSLFHHGEK
jgi:hypothetical protein